MPFWTKVYYINSLGIMTKHRDKWGRTRRFSEPIFRPSGATNHWKNAINHDFPTFSYICIFFLLILLSSNLSLLSASSLFYFSSIYIVGNLISKFLSIIIMMDLNKYFRKYMKKKIIFFSENYANIIFKNIY